MARKKEPFTEQMERSHFADAQAQFLDKLEATNQRWFEHAIGSYSCVRICVKINYGAFHPRCHDCLPGLGPVGGSR